MTAKKPDTEKDGLRVKVNNPSLRAKSSHIEGRLIRTNSKAFQKSSELPSEMSGKKLYLVERTQAKDSAVKWHLLEATEITPSELEVLKWCIKPCPNNSTWCDGIRENLLKKLEVLEK